jgi:hypothetical protein
MEERLAKLEREFDTMKVAIGRVLESTRTLVETTNNQLRAQQAEILALRDRCARLEMRQVKTRPAVLLSGGEGE